MLENGVILASFANKYLNDLDAEQLDQYDRLINLPTNDWDIFYWATRTKPTPVEFETPVMDKLREHLKSKVSSDKVNEQSVLGKTRPDDIVMPALKSKYDLDVDVNEVSLTDYSRELFDPRKKTFRGKEQMDLMTAWRRSFFKARLKRIIGSPTSIKSLSNERLAKKEIYTQRVEKKEIANEQVTPKDVIDSPYERHMKHHNFMQHLLGSGRLTDNPLDYDDEAEAWADMIWHRNYGSSDDKITPTRLTCSSCKTYLHCCDPGLEGYVPLEILRSFGLENKEVDQRCQRCKFSETYGTELSHEMAANKYEDFLRHLSTKPASVICMLVDLTDLPGSIWRGFVDLAGRRHKLIVVGNKLDLLPYDGSKMLNRVLYSMRKNLSKLRFNDSNLCIHDSLLISARTGFGLEGLVSRLLNSSEPDRDIYLVGCNNTGKSTLFSALLQSDLCAIRKGDLISRVSTYSVPETNNSVKMLRFPLNNAEEWELVLRRRRAERKERNTGIREISLEAMSERRQATMPHMSILANRLDFPPLRAGKSDDQLQIYDQEEQTRLPRFTDDHPMANIRQDEPLTGGCEETAGPEQRYLYHAPSSTGQDQVHELLTKEERLEVFPNETFIPRRYSMRPLETIFIAGLARLDLLTAQSSVTFSIFASRYLPIHVIPTKKADQFYNDLLGSPYLGVPFDDVDSGRLALWPGLDSPPEGRWMHIKGIQSIDGVADVVFSSIGWAMVSLNPEQECVVRAYTPQGRGIFLREPPLLARANRRLGKKIRDTPLFKHPHYVADVMGVQGEPRRLLEDRKINKE